MTVQAQVDLLFDPHDLSLRARQEVADAAQDTTVRGALGRALFSQHIFMITEARRRVAEAQQVTPELMVAVMDYVWQAYTPRFVRISGPQIALAYGRALQAAEAGAVDSRYIESLAAEHAKRLSGYFHESSRDAVVEAFNTFVNRKVPIRAAADKALSAYGLTSRQIRGYAANMAFDTKVNSSIFRRAEVKALDYVAKSLRARITKFAGQEEHDLDQQAEQIAWLWMVDHGQLPENAEKIWLTAKDEMTCKVCAPMHGKVVKVGEQFELPDKIRLWVPGVHPNCRCKVRFRVPRQMEIAKADHPYYGDDPDERDYRGRFAARNRSGPRFKEPDRREDEDRSRVQQIIDTPAEPVIDMTDVQLETPVTMTPEPVIDMTEKPISMVTEPAIDMAQQTEAVRMTPQSDFISMEEQLEDVDLRNQLAPVTMEMTKELVRREEARSPKILYMGTVDLVNESGKPQPLYKVLRAHEELDAEGRAEFTTDEEWTSDVLEVNAEAVEWRREAIKEATKEILLDPSAEYTLKDGMHEGMDVHVILSPDQVRDLVAWTANQNSAIERGRSADAEMEVGLYIPAENPDEEDESAFQETESIKFRELARMFRLHPKDFNMAVAVVTRGHMSELGTTDVRYYKNETTAAISGQFEVSTTHPGETILGSENALGIVFFHMEPADVEVEVLGGDDDWREEGS